MLHQYSAGGRAKARPYIVRCRIGTPFWVSVCALIMLFVLSFGVDAQETQTRTPRILNVDPTNGTVRVNDLCPVDANVLYADIQAAVDCANLGDTVQLPAGSVSGTVSIRKALILRGDPDGTTLDAGATGRPLTVTDGARVLVENVTLTNGRANFGGGVYLADGELILANSRVTGNTAVNDGGGVYAQSGTVALSNTTIENNIAQGQGSAFVLIDAMMLLSDQQTDLITGTGVLLGTSDISVNAPTVVDANPTPAITPSQITNENPHQIAVDWMAVLLDAVQNEVLSPPEASRIYAYASIALYEGFRPGFEDATTLAGLLNGLETLPQPDPDAAYNWSLVATQATHDLTNALFLQLRLTAEDSRRTFAALLEGHRASLGERVPFNIYNRSLVYGEQLGAALIDWMQQDNYAIAQNLTYELPTGDPAYWRPLDGQEPMQPHWDTLRTFSLPMAESCDVPLGFAYDMTPGSAFFAQVSEVKLVTENATDEQRMQALYWADDPGMSSTPPGHWVAIQNELITQFDLSLQETVTMYALTNIAMADAFISSWEAKYRYQLVRPISVIHNVLGDTEWQTHVGTPPFPEYPSGHSVVSGAAAEILTHLFGDVSFTDADFTSVGFERRIFESFRQAAEEAAISRLYGGIHYRVASENSLQQGVCVAQTTLGALQLR